MIRRITAVLLALMMLISVFPAAASADDTVYYVGDTIWVSGIGNEPTAPTVGGHWEEVLDVNGNQVKRSGCTKEVHEHTPWECWDAVEGLICTKEEHTHGIVCSFMAAEYQWIVVADIPTGGGGSGGGSGGGITPGGSGEGENRGAIYFDIYNTDEDGNALSGVTFLLFEYTVDEETGEKSRAYVFNSDIELNLGTEEEPLTEEELAEQEELDYQCSPVTTDANGKAYFNELERYVEDSASSVTWYLAQESSAFLESGPYYNEYMVYNQLWKINIVRTGEDSYSMSIEPDPETSSVYGSASYDSDSRVFTCINGRVDCELNISVKLDGLGEGITMGDWTNMGARACVTVYGPDGYETKVDLPAENEYGTMDWGMQLENLQPGEYTVTADDSAAQIEGYTLDKTTYKVVIGEEASEGQTVTLSQSPRFGTVTITHHYTANVVETEPEDKSNTVIVYAEDSSGNKLSGAQFELRDSSGNVVSKLQGAAEYVLDDELLAYAVDGQKVTYTLLQTQAPSGYNLAGEKYYIDVEMNNDEPNVTLKKDVGTFTWLFGRSGVESGANGEQIAVFTNISKTIIARAVDQQGNTLTGGAYTLYEGKSKNGNVVAPTEDLTVEEALANLEELAGGEKKEYTLMQTAAPAGYNVTDKEYSITVEADKTVTLENCAEYGSNGEQIAIFTNSRKTNAQIQLTCDVEVKVDSSCWNYADTVGEFENKKNTFVLSWKENGKVETEELTLRDGETKAFKEKLSFGTEYTIDCKGEHDHECNLPIEGVITATLTEKTADIDYEVRRGSTLDLYMLKVDSTGKEKLAGAKFSLKDSNGDELRVYTTKTDGKIDIEGIFTEPGTFTLKETQAPEEYDKLRTPITIEIVTDYETKSIGGRTVKMQNLVEKPIDHKNVSKKQSDGSYLIKNYLSSGNPQTGDVFDTGLWTGVMAVSLMGLAAMAVGMAKKKRRAR